MLILQSALSFRLELHGLQYTFRDNSFTLLRVDRRHWPQAALRCFLHSHTRECHANMEAGAQVRLFGLVKAAQHNGKRGVVLGHATGRIVKLKNLIR